MQLGKLACTVTDDGLLKVKCCILQEMKSDGIPAITANIAKVKLEAERLEVMDKAAGILAELLYTENLLAEIKEYRPIMIHVSSSD